MMKKFLAFLLIVSLATVLFSACNLEKTVVVAYTIYEPMNYTDENGTSTRLKAGTCQKLILNMLSTGAMVRSGYVYENLMINLKPSNVKLRGRVVRIVREITGLEEAAATKLLEESDWIIRDAIHAWHPQG